MVHIRCSIDICWVREWMNDSLLKVYHLYVDDFQMRTSWWTSACGSQIYDSDHLPCLHRNGEKVLLPCRVWSATLDDSGLFVLQSSSSHDMVTWEKNLALVLDSLAPLLILEKVTLALLPTYPESVHLAPSLLPSLLTWTTETDLSHFSFYTNPHSTPTECF